MRAPLPLPLFSARISYDCYICIYAFLHQTWIVYKCALKLRLIYVYAIRIRLGSECRDDDEDWAMSIGQKTNTRKYSVHFRMIAWQNICFYAAPLCVSVFLFFLSISLFLDTSFFGGVHSSQTFVDGNEWLLIISTVTPNWTVGWSQNAIYTAKRKANFASTAECASSWRSFPIGRNRKMCFA